jgi:hypothetical protein
MLLYGTMEDLRNSDILASYSPSSLLVIFFIGYKDQKNPPLSTLLLCNSFWILLYSIHFYHETEMTHRMIIYICSHRAS